MSSNRQKFPAHPTIPGSCTSFPINLAGLASYLLVTYYLTKYKINTYSAAIFSILALALTIAILEKIFRRESHRHSSGIDFRKRQKADASRVGVKILGLYATIAFAAVIYWLLPIYREGFYQNYFKFIVFLAPFILVLGIPYFFVIDMFMKQPKDSHWHLGMLLLGKSKLVDFSILKNHFLGWLVKIFFLALMFPYLISNTGYIIHTPFTSPGENFGRFYDYMYNLIFAIDLVFVCAGYLLTLKIFDSHIRSAEPTFFGWMVAIYCYDPFWSHLIRPKYINYEDGYYWGHMLADHAGAYKVWGLIILSLLFIYILATISFGIRFSNLTNRGIITNGPYRWMKHPAYISKNIAWWLISVPFISSANTGIAVKHCLLLLLLNFIYYLRAVTEERHLSLDPVYIKYAEAMNTRGLFRSFYRRFPSMRYRVEKYIQDGKLKKLWF